jgi:hypothetical protein
MDRRPTLPPKGGTTNRFSKEKWLFMKESFLRATAWLSLSLLTALSLAPAALCR